MSLISLENFDQESTKAPLIDSPRSLEACKRQGIIPRELIFQTIDDLKLHNRDLDPKGLQAKYDHLEQRRRQKIRDLIAERVKIIEQERNGQWSVDGFIKSALVSKFSGGASSLIEKEKAQLERIKKRQQKEIEQMMEYEMGLQQIRRENEEKTAFQRQKELQRMEELAKKRAVQEEFKRRKDQEREEKSAKEALKLAQQLEKARQKERDRELYDQQKQKEREQKLVEKELERKEVQLRRDQKKEEIIKEKQQEVLQKQEEMEMKNQMRIKAMQEQQQKKEQENEEQRKKLQVKLEYAKLHQENELKKKKEEYDHKQHISEVKKAQYEAEKAKQMAEQQELAGKHSEEIRRVIQANNEKEHNLKLERLKKIEDAERRKKELELEQEKEREVRAKLEEQKEEQRKLVYRENEIKQKQKVDGLLSKFTLKDELVSKIQEDRREQLRDKRNEENLLRNDKRDNVDRMMRMQEHQRQILQMKIEEKLSRATRIQADLNDLLAQRGEMRKDIDKQKRDIVQKIERMREGKLDPEDLMKELGLESKHQASTTTKSEQHPPQASTQQPPNPQPKSKPELNRSPTLEQPKISPSLTVQEINQRAGLKEIQEQEQKQNLEMLRLLEEEQDNEIARDQAFTKVSEKKDKLKLEKIHQMERSKAQLRIQKLSDKHTQEIQKLKLKYKIV